MSNGETVKRRRPRKRAQRVRWEFQNESDSFFFDELMRVYGESTTFVLKRESESAAHGQSLLIYGFATYRGPSSITDQAPYGFGSIELTMVEV